MTKIYQNAVILKRQRGNQYGFDDEVDSPQHVTKNMSEAMLDDPAATHTKSVENYFGNLDGRLSKSGARGFEKSVDDLIIKYSQDLIKPGEYRWRDKHVKTVAKDLKAKAEEFSREQKSLLKSVTQEEADNLTQENKIIKVVGQCKESHNGPFTTTSELNNVVNNWEDTEQKLHYVLNLEIRFRKLSFTTVKNSCSLFRQRNMSIQEKVKNL